MSNSPVASHLADGILTLSLAINENNSMTPEGFRALDAAFTEAAENPAVRAVVLGSSAKGFFCNGLNPDAVHGAPEAQLTELLEYFFSVLKKILFFPVPVVAAVNGHAMGYGAMLALMSDFRLMVDRGARIAYPEINLGIGMPIFVARPLQDMVGVNNARDLLVLGKALKGPDAEAMGLIDELVAPDELEERAQKMAKKLAGLSNSAIKSMKATLRARYAHGLDELLAEDMKVTMAQMTSADAIEGFTASVETRRPMFS